MATRHTGRAAIAESLRVVIDETEAEYFHGPDIIARQRAERQYYFHHGLGSMQRMVLIA